MKIRLVKTSDAGFKPLLAKILSRRGARAGDVEQRVEAIVTAVQRHGDRAVLRYTKLFDRVRLTAATMEVKPEEIERAVAKVVRKDLSTLRLAAKRIAFFHRRQLQKSWQYRDPLGMILGQRITPLERVGVYVPGGKACYPSTVLMNVIPAKVAGVKEIIMTSPIGVDGGDHSRRRPPWPASIASSASAERRPWRRLRLAPGRFPRSIKIVGPGNIFVATAKRMVFGEVNIDSIAGPSEILLLADDSADPLACRRRHAVAGGTR
jgi:histidinol dehydrogenase